MNFEARSEGAALAAYPIDVMLDEPMRMLAPKDLGFDLAGRTVDGDDRRVGVEATGFGQIFVQAPGVACNEDGFRRS